MLYFLSFLLVFVSSTIVVSAETISLNFDTLPSNQGWEYYFGGNSVLETDVFSVDNDTLYQNSLEVGYASAGSNRYHLNNVIKDSLPFTISVTAKIIQEKSNIENHPFGFMFGGIFVRPEEDFKTGIGIGIGSNMIKDNNTSNIISTSIDNTKFHNYLLEVNPQTGYSFYVDEALIYTGSLGNYPIEDNDQMLNYLLLGDGTGATNAQVEITKYVFTQYDNDNCTYSDSDYDGVIDILDKCPNTPTDSYTDKNGCPSSLEAVYTEEDMRNVINKLLEWDINKDKKIGLIEVIEILKDSVAGK